MTRNRGRAMWTGEKIKELREEGYGETQEVFAIERLGVAVGTLRDWEQDVRKPKGTALKLLQILADQAMAVRK